MKPIAQSSAASTAGAPVHTTPEDTPGHFRSNLRDLRFVLFELLERGSVLGSAPWVDLDVDTARAVLSEADRLATGPLAASWKDADAHPPTFDRDTGAVTLPPSFVASYRAYRESGWWRFDVPEALGGTPCPPSLRWAVQELVLGANPAIHMYACGPYFAGVLHELGTPAQSALARLIVEREWGTSMALTEPDAGSDVGAARMAAVPSPTGDGSWHLTGVKRFITNGEHDLAENIVHFVLARPVGARAGTKGLSLFVVPKWHVDLADGALGARNGVRATALEHKLGLRASATCELTFGDDPDTPAVGWLVGDQHDGIAQMFRIIEDARMMVGTKAMATLSTAYLGALDYARTRTQGADLARRGDKSAPRVAIVDHPDVRRMLLTMKAQAEGLRALVLYTASVHDEVRAGGHGVDGPDVGGPDVGGPDVDAAAALHALLLPVVKGYGSERCSALLTDAIQVVGGAGYLVDHPFEQYLRDAKIDTLYEGTTGIQGLDLFFRKVVRDDGRALTALLGEIGSYAASGPALGVDAGTAAVLDLLGEAVRAVAGSARTLADWAGGAGQSGAEGGAPTRVYRAGENTTRLLMMLGDVVVAWLLLRSADIARTALVGAGELPARERAFYEGKVAAAQWFARTRLPEVRVAAEQLRSTDDSLMTLDPNAL